MVNFNGNPFPLDANLFGHTNRGFRYGDALFEEVRVIDGKVIFWEDHYFRLMASMRILRMEIPMKFTMEFLQEQIIQTLAHNDRTNQPVMVRITVFRFENDSLLPTFDSVSYLMETRDLSAPFYTLDFQPYELELFKDHYLGQNLLSNLDTTSKMVEIIASVHAHENGYDGCLLLNHNKQVVGTIAGVLFLVRGNAIKTPPLSDGVKNSVVRKKLLEIVQNLDNYTTEEASISPFELQKADELFEVSTSLGIRPITKYRKKEYQKNVAQDLLGKLNAHARLA